MEKQRGNSDGADGGETHGRGIGRGSMDAACAPMGFTAVALVAALILSTTTTTAAASATSRCTGDENNTSVASQSLKTGSSRSYYVRECGTGAQKIDDAIVPAFVAAAMRCCCCRSCRCPSSDGDPYRPSAKTKGGNGAGGGDSNGGGGHGGQRVAFPRRRSRQDPRVAVSGGSRIRKLVRPPEVANNKVSPGGDRRTCVLCRVLHEGEEDEKSSVSGDYGEGNGDEVPADGDMRCFVNLWSKVQSAAWHVNACLAVLQLTTPATQVGGDGEFIWPVDPLNLRPFLALKFFFQRDQLCRLWECRQERNIVASGCQTASNQWRKLQQATPGVCRQQQHAQQKQQSQQQQRLQNNATATVGRNASGRTLDGHDQHQHVTATRDSPRRKGARTKGARKLSVRNGSSKSSSPPSSNKGSTTVNASPKGAFLPPKNAPSNSSNSINDWDSPAAYGEWERRPQQHHAPLQCNPQRRCCRCHRGQPTGEESCAWVQQLRTVLDAAGFASSS